MANFKKLSFEELYNSTTMFYVNPVCEAKIQQMIDDKTNAILAGVGTITSKATLKQYIITHSDSLDQLLSVTEISTERFKRIVSMIRKDRGYVFTSEWSLKKVRNAMLESPAMMETILNLLWDGKNDPKMKKCIPAFYLENMTIDAPTLAKLQNRDSVRQLAKRSLEGTYSNMIGDSILCTIENKLNRICAQYGLTYEKGGQSSLN